MACSSPLTTYTNIYGDLDVSSKVAHGLHDGHITSHACEVSLDVCVMIHELSIA
mgnify:CR=1 FL=1